MTTLSPTFQIYQPLQASYDFFNQELFSNELPHCILLLDSKNPRTAGYYSKNKYINAQGICCDGIALNPQHFGEKKIIEVLQTMLHEMCHLWQNHFGTHNPNYNKCYHNKEWSKKMESLGLMPSDSGQEGGKKVGQKMSDYPIVDGLFLKTCEKLLTQNFQITWQETFSIVNGVITNLNVSANSSDNEESGSQSADEEKPTNKSNRLKYTCPQCTTNIWGKADLNIICADCNVAFACE